MEEEESESCHFEECRSEQTKRINRKSAKAQLLRVSIANGGDFKPQTLDDKSEQSNPFGKVEN